MDRLVRAEPKRTRPLRNVSHHLQHSSLIGRRDIPMSDDPTKTQPRSPNTIISDAVSRGYQVIEDQILQGRNAAERFRAGTYNAADVEADIKQLLDRVMDLVKELGTTGFELAAAAIRDPRAPPRPQQPGHQQSSDVAIEIHGARPAEVACKLCPPFARFVPSVPALYSSDREVSPLKNIRFELRDNRPVLVIDIPEKQPPGKYSGAIVDRETNQAGGFVTVFIRQ